MKNVIYNGEETKYKSFAAKDSILYEYKTPLKISLLLFITYEYHMSLHSYSEVEHDDIHIQSMTYNCNRPFIIVSLWVREVHG